jgi:O2-independent ubiquinone biosynthesis protein UbiV
MTVKTKHMTLTMGPVLFNWSPDTWRDFYYRVADEAPVDHVVVGEIVCSKRTPFFMPVLPDVIERLEAAGKRVILASPILVMNKRERTGVEDLFDSGFTVEANDTTALQNMGGNAFTVGPFINIYNEATRAYFERLGAERIALPGELSLASIKPIARGATVPIEIFGFGRMPLAISARCYHARAEGLSKDSCRYVCANDPDGMDIGTLDGDDFLSVNGVQTLSHTFHNVIADLDTLAKAGVGAIRLSPHDIDMVAVAGVFRQTLDGGIAPREAAEKLEHLADGFPMSNGFLHAVEGFKASPALAECKRPVKHWCHLFN